MSTVTGLTAARMLAIEAASVVGGLVDANGHLILTKHDASTVDAGAVVGPGASMGPSVPSNPKIGQIWYDTNNLTGLTDLMASKNPATSTANWVAYAYGYDTGETFAIAGGGCTITWTNANNHFAGIPINVTQGEQYLIKARVRVPVGSPDVTLTVGYKTSGQKMTIKGVDVTLLLAYTADAASLSFGIEAGGATGTCIVKELSVYQVNQKGFPEYFWDGTSWVQTEHSAQKADIYSRVNTYGDQTIAGNKTFTGSTSLQGGTVVGDATNDAWVSVDAPASKYKGLLLKKGGLARWAMYADSGAESGSNAGANFGIARYNDAGAAIDVPLSIGRAFGEVNLANALNVTGLSTLNQAKFTRAVDISSTDLNSLKTGGWYTGVTLTNAPHGNTSAQWYVEVIHHATAATDSVVQIATLLDGVTINTVTITEPITFKRRCVAGVWSSWVHMAGGLPVLQSTDITNQAVTQTASFANLPTTAALTFASPFPWDAEVHLSGWLSVANLASSDLRIAVAISGANTAAAPASGWQAALYESNTPALTGAPTKYASHSVDWVQTALAAGSTVFTVQGYKTSTATNSVNYGRLWIRPIRFTNG